jgi:hypothetical protein
MARSSTSAMARSSTSANAAGAARDAGSAIAHKSAVPLLVAGGTAAGLAGGLVLGGRRRRGLRALVAPRRRVLGVPLGRKNGLAKTAEALGKMAAQLGSTTDQVAETTGEVRQIREQLDKANRQSPIEVLVDALTHRRGAHKREGG